MSIFDRLQLVFQSPFAIVLYALFVCLLILIGTYLFLHFRQRNRDQFVYRFRKYFERVGEATRDYPVIGNPIADFWGRQTVVKNSDDEPLNCLALPPDLQSDSFLRRYETFSRAVEYPPIPNLALTIKELYNPGLILFFNGMFKEDGLPKVSLQNCFSDKRLTYDDHKNILKAISHALVALHERCSEEGEPLFHGFLMPRNIFLDLDTNHHVCDITISEAGLAYSVGTNQLRKRVSELQQGVLTIDRYHSFQLIDQIPYLAPELRSQKGEIGPAADFYTFGAIAAALCMQKRFIHEGHVDWEQIPQGWRSFVKSCLEEDPGKRPRVFSVS